MLKNKRNGKVYIGATSQRLTKRWQGGHGYEKNAGLYSDIQRDGWNEFWHIPLRENLAEDQALRMEESLIEVMGAMNPTAGYNLRSGGRSNFPAESVGRHISQAKMGHEVKPEVRRRLSQYGRRPVIQLSLDDNPVKMFASITEAAKSVGTFKSNIWAACMGKKLSSRGYHWAFLDRWNDAKRAEEHDRVKHSLRHEGCGCGDE